MKRLFVAQIVIVIEEQWLGSGAKVVRTETSYAIHSQMLSAIDEESAYEKVKGWLDNEGFSDSNHDGAGDMTKMYALGIHQIEEIVSLDELVEAAAGPYGVDLPVFSLAAVDKKSGAPTVSEKRDLEIFRLLEFSRGPEHGFSFD
jgi:hypothetical protein